MSKRDEIWAEIDADYQQRTIHKIARFGLEWTYDRLPDDVRHMAKRCLLDAIGCAIGGHVAKGRAICEKVVLEMGGAPEASIIGSGRKTSTYNAALVNAFMVRYLDYNDLGGGGHNSDAIPAILAVAEHEKRNGADFLTALVLSYELGARWMRFLFTGDMTADYKRITGRGWCPDVRGGLNVPPSLGLLMGMNEEQIASAIGATIVRSLPSNHLDANDEEFVMAKNLRFGHVACDAILYCRLAKEGFTGPRRAFEGEFGFDLIVNGGPGEADELVAEPDRFDILENSFKPLCVNFTTQSGVQSTIALCKEHDIHPDDVESVKIVCCAREARHTTYAAKKYPRNGESADHSLHFANALAIIERGFGPKSFLESKFTDPQVLDLIERIDFEVNEDWPGFCDSGGSVITLKDGRVVEKFLEAPHGHYTDPLSDGELETKFSEMALEHYSQSQVDELISTIWNADKLSEMSELTQLLTFSK